MVIVHKLDRFSRNRYDSIIYRRELKIVGVELRSVLENIDGSQSLFCSKVFWRG